MIAWSRTAVDGAGGVSVRVNACQCADVCEHILMIRNACLCGSTRTDLGAPGESIVGHPAMTEQLLPGATVEHANRPWRHCRGIQGTLVMNRHESTRLVYGFQAAQGSTGHDGHLFFFFQPLEQFGPREEVAGTQWSARRGQCLNT